MPTPFRKSVKKSLTRCWTQKKRLFQMCVKTTHSAMPSPFPKSVDVELRRLTVSDIWCHPLSTSVCQTRGYANLHSSRREVCAAAPSLHQRLPRVHEKERFHTVHHSRLRDGSARVPQESPVVQKSHSFCHQTSPYW